MVFTLRIEDTDISRITQVSMKSLKSFFILTLESVIDPNIAYQSATRITFPD